MGDTLCLMFLDPMGSGQPGFSTGYLYGCAVFFALLVVEFVVVVLLQ